MKLLENRMYYLVTLVLILGIFFSYLAIKEIAYIQELKREIVYFQQLIEENETFPVKGLEKTSISSPYLVVDLWEAAEKMNLELLKFNSSENEGPEKVYTITLSGNYQNFINWLNTIENLAYLVNVEELQTQRLNQDNDNLLFTIGLNVING